MKVKDIIAELSKANPETEVSFQMADGCCSDVEFLDINDVDFDEARPEYKHEERVTFYFNAPWFLASCRKSGAAKRAAQEIVDSHAKWQKEQEEKAKK